MNLAAKINALRAARNHLEAQIEANTDTLRLDVGLARRLLAALNRDLAEAEGRARLVPELAYLFPRRRR